jgi:HAMP domain-containing protein
MNAEEMDKLVGTLRRRYGREWAEMVEYLRRTNKLGAVARAIANRNVDAAIQGIERAARAFARQVNAGFALAQQKTARWLNDQVPAPIRWDVANTRSVSWMEQNTLELVRGIGTETRAIIHAAMTDGLAAGTNPKVIAREIRDSLGLTQHQRKQVQSYRRALQTGDFSNALGRELADGRYDRTILAAQRDGRALTRTEVNRMVDRYRAGQVKRRAETIARTEAIRSAHQGQRELFQEAIDDGDIEAKQLVRTWVHYNGGKHPRDFHHVMHGQVRGHNEPFRSGLGHDLMFPGDPDAPAEETINCRCTITVRYVRSDSARERMRSRSTRPA